MTHELQIEKLKQVFGSSILNMEQDRVGCPIIWIERNKAIDALKYLKDSEGFEYTFMADLTAYDDMGTSDEAQGRFVIVYNLYSPQHKQRIRVKCRIAEGVTMPTAIGVWEAANWAEREVFDMFGVKFEGHPDLRRILLDVRWEGYPLRKDYYWRKYQLFNDPEIIPEHLLIERQPTGVDRSFIKD